MYYLVTGAAGFIGFHIARQLLETGMHVIGYDNVNAYYDISIKKGRLEVLQKYTGFTFYQKDLEDKPALEEVFKKHRPDIVIHLAAQAGVGYSLTNPEAFVGSNLVGFVNMLEACRAYPVRHLIYASSSSVYGGNTKTPFSVQDRVDQPISLYAATKKSNELMAYCYSHLFGLITTGLRFFTVYGPYGRPDMALFKFTRAILADEPIRVFNYGDMMRDFTYVEDVVHGVISLSQRSRAFKMQPAAYIYNIGNQSPVMLLDFIAAIEKAVGKKANIRLEPMQPGDVPKTYADVAELMEDTGFRPDTPFEQGVQRFVDWYREWFQC